MGHAARRMVENAGVVAVR